MIWQQPTCCTQRGHRSGTGRGTSAWVCRVADEVRQTAEKCRANRQGNFPVDPDIQKEARKAVENMDRSTAS